MVTEGGAGRSRQSRSAGAVARDGASARGVGQGGSLGRHRWIQYGTSAFPWEQAAFEHVKALLPDADPYLAWADFNFAARTGHVRQCDLFVVTPGGLYLIEIKSHPGRVSRHGDTFVFRDERVRREDNPLPLVNQKAKELRGELEAAARRLGIRLDFALYVEEAVFFSAPNLVSELNEQQQVKIYGREDRDTGLPRIWSDLLGIPPRRRRVTSAMADTVERLMGELGVRGSRSHLRIGKWTMQPQVLESGPTWEDRIATCPDLPGEQRRARVYLTQQLADDDRRRSTLRAAQREYQVLQGITHRGIAQAVDFEQHDVGPVVLFQHHDGDLRLDQYMDVYGETLGIDTRLGLVRQLAEAVQYAHRRHLYHQALAARSVYVTSRQDGSNPVIRIGDWQTAARDQDSYSPNHNYLLTNLSSSHVEAAAQLYLAPEWRSGEYPDPVMLDVFGLGAITHLVFTGKPPAASRGELIEMLTRDKGLHLFSVADGMTAPMDDLVYAATRANAYDRTDSAEAFLRGLDAVEEHLTAPEPVAEIDPLSAVKGQIVYEGWRVARVLGAGATAKALLVERTEPEGSPRAGEVEQRVLKVALDQEKAASLLDEAATLREVGGGSIVRLLEEPLELAGRTVLVLEFAGERSLARWLKDEDTPTLDQIDRFSGDLLVALDHLDGKGVWHRDIKPDNLGVHQRRDRTYQLTLYDFSHSRASEKDIRAGTSAYLDPFLGTLRRPAYDGYAERYAAGATLHELVTHGKRPVWGDGVTDPRALDDELPYLAEELFDPALRERLTAFFARCFHRDHNRRFSRMREMHDAWRAVITGASTAVPPTNDATQGEPSASPDAARDAAARQASLETPLAAAGLSPRAVSAAARLAATTVGELLAVPLYQITKARGAGNLTKRELNQRWRQWRELLGPVRAPTSAAGRSAAGHPAQSGSETAPAAETGALRCVGADLALSGADVAGARSGGPDRTPAEAERRADRAALEMASDLGKSYSDAEYLAADIDELADLVLGPWPVKATKHFEAVRVSLGLPNQAGEAPAQAGLWPTQEQVGKAIKAHQATVSTALGKAAARWLADPVLARVRAELVEILASAGRVMEVGELAAQLRARRGSRSQEADPLLAARRAAAVVHALIEAERLRGQLPESIGDEDAGGVAADPGQELDSDPDLSHYEPRFLAPRYGERILVALDSVDDPSMPTADDLRAYAAKLGQLADALATRDPLPGPDAVLRELRALKPPKGAPSLSDTRLVRLASAASKAALVSQRLELYPKDLPLARALRLAQAGSYPDADGLNRTLVLTRVRSRFPDVASGLRDIGARELEDALREAGYESLEYDPSADRFVSRGTHSWPYTSVTRHTFGSRPPLDERDPSRVLQERLASAAQRGGFRAISVPVLYVPEAITALTGAFDVRSVDVAGEFLRLMRGYVAEQGRPTWEKVLDADAELTSSGRLPHGFSRYVAEVWRRLGSALSEAAGPRQVVLLHDAGLFSRYTGGTELLAQLRNAARRPADLPHGLWVVCPTEELGRRPRLDGVVVEVEAHEWIKLGSDGISALRPMAGTPTGRVE